MVFVCLVCCNLPRLWLVSVAVWGLATLVAQTAASVVQVAGPVAGMAGGVAAMFRSEAGPCFLKGRFFLREAGKKGRCLWSVAHCLHSSLPQPDSKPQQQQGTPARTSAPDTTREEFPAWTDGKSHDVSKFIVQFLFHPRKILFSKPKWRPRRAEDVFFSAGVFCVRLASSFEPARPGTGTGVLLRAAWAASACEVMSLP